jgi:RNA 3'-terminal phosphate cyclase (ATP)
VDEHLADQLLLPLALAGGGSFATGQVSDHLRSNALVIETFLGRRTTWKTRCDTHEVTVH